MNKKELAKRQAERAQKEKLDKFVGFFKKYKWPLAALVVVAIIIAGQYTSMFEVLKNTAYCAIGIIVLICCYQLYKYYKSSPNEKIKRKRVIALYVSGMVMIAFTLFIQLWFKDTELGQDLQRKIYGHNDINLTETQSPSDLIDQFKADD